MVIMEGYPGKNLKKTLETAIVAGSLLVPHESLQAIEMEPSISWMNGIEKIKDNVFEEGPEQLAVFVLFADGTSRWLKFTEGEELKVRMNIKAVKEEMLNIHQEGKEIARMCHIHTHPVEAIVSYAKVDNPQKVYAPPSYPDTFVISKGGIPDIISSFGEEIGEHVESQVAAVLDPQGVWYYRAFTEDELQANKSHSNDSYTEIAEDFEKKRLNFVRSSARDGFSFENEYSEIQSAYGQVNTKVRFVPYDQIGNEGVCAGID